MKRLEILEFPKDIPQLLNFVQTTRKTFRMVTPFYDEEEVREILRKLPHGTKLRTLIKANPDSSVRALEKLYRRGKVKHAKNIHAKVLVFDESAAIISSLNIAGWRSLNLGVLLRGKICKEIANIVDRWWRESEELLPKDIARLRGISRKRKPQISRRFVELGKTIPVPRYSFTEDVREHVIININWSPSNYERVCTRKEAKENTSCHEQKWCVHVHKKRYQRRGCKSSRLFKDYEYATRKNAIKENRLAFFIAKNPNLRDEYYFAGVLWMKGLARTKSNRPIKAWKDFFYFSADKGKSIRFPSSRSKAITLGSIFGKRLGSPLRGNPTRKISTNDAIRILEKYYSKTGDKKAEHLIELLR